MISLTEAKALLKANTPANGQWTCDQVQSIQDLLYPYGVDFGNYGPKGKPDPYWVIRGGVLPPTISSVPPDFIISTIGNKLYLVSISDCYHRCHPDYDPIIDKKKNIQFSELWKLSNQFPQWYLYKIYHILLLEYLSKDLPKIDGYHYSVYYHDPGDKIPYPDQVDRVLREYYGNDCFE